MTRAPWCGADLAIMTGSERRAPSRPVSNPNGQRAETVLGALIASWRRDPAPCREILLTSAATALAHGFQPASTSGVERHAICPACLHIVR